MVIRAISPPGVPGTLADPTLELRDSNGVLLEANDDCEFSLIPPPNATDACIERYLNSGAYTAIVAGKNGETGVGLVEVYNLGGGPSPTPITAPLLPLDLAGGLRKLGYAVDSKISLMIRLETCSSRS